MSLDTRLSHPAEVRLESIEICVKNLWFVDVSHALMSFGTLRRCLVPQTYGRNWALADLPNLRRCFTPTQIRDMPFRAVGRCGRRRFSGVSADQFVGN